jgi:L-threonylcarbamoyladenylate synthase
MRTRLIPADDAGLAEAARVLRAGGLVAFPTETVYGLGADALDPTAVARIFAAKERPPGNPLIVHLAGAEDLPAVAADVPRIAREAIRHFWPGPLSLVLPRADAVPLVTTGGLDTVAVRVPAHPVARALISAVARPIAAPSANRSGRPSPTQAAHVLEDLDGRVDLVVDGGATEVGLESTVLDCTEDPPVLLRPGGVSLEALERALGALRVAGADDAAAARSPGLRYRHYAPRARLLVVDRGEGERAAAPWLAAGQPVALLATRAVTAALPGLRLRAMPADLEGYARELFAALRECDAEGAAVIVVEVVADDGLGRAIMDRLRRAALG